MSGKRGRPTKLTPKVQAAVCKAIRETKLSLADCGRSLGLNEHQLNDWIHRGRNEPEGIFHDFAVAVEKARAEGSQMLLGRIAKAGKSSRYWQANVALLSATEPQYAPRVRLEVGKQLGAAIERLTVEFAGEPQLLERVLAALAGDEADAEGDA